MPVKLQLRVRFKELRNVTAGIGKTVIVSSEHTDEDRFVQSGAIVSDFIDGQITGVVGIWAGASRVTEVIRSLIGRATDEFATLTDAKGNIRIICSGIRTEKQFSIGFGDECNNGSIGYGYVGTRVGIEGWSNSSTETRSGDQRSHSSDASSIECVCAVGYRAEGSRVEISGFVTGQVCHQGNAIDEIVITRRLLEVDLLKLLDALVRLRDVGGRRRGVSTREHVRQLRDENASEGNQDDQHDQQLDERQALLVVTTRHACRENFGYLHIICLCFGLFGEGLRVLRPPASMFFLTVSCHLPKVCASARPGGRHEAEMDEKKLLAARAANLDAVAMTNKEQPPRARPKLSLSQLTDRAIRPLNREREA